VLASGDGHSVRESSGGCQIDLTTATRVAGCQISPRVATLFLRGFLFHFLYPINIFLNFFFFFFFLQNALSKILPNQLIQLLSNVSPTKTILNFTLEIKRKFPKHPFL
jgi:hypothetical protein